MSSAGMQQPPKWGAMLDPQDPKYLHWGVLKTGLHAYPGQYIMECRHRRCKGAHAIPMDQFHVYGFILPFETTIENVERVKREKQGGK